MEIGVTELLNRYNKAGYKYDAVMAMYAHDFVEPTNVINLEKAVKLWNSKHKEVQLKIATPPEFLKYIETKYAAQIPTYQRRMVGTLVGSENAVAANFRAGALRARPRARGRNSLERDCDDAKIFRFRSAISRRFTI